MSFQNQSRPISPSLIWWSLWTFIIIGLLLMNTLIVPSTEPGKADETLLFSAIAVVELLLSCALRWLLLPRMSTRQKALPVFIIGMAMAEGCGLLGIVLGGENRDTLVVLAFLGLLQYVPVFVNKFEA